MAGLRVILRDPPTAAAIIAAIMGATVAGICRGIPLLRGRGAAGSEGCAIGFGGGFIRSGRRSRDLLWDLPPD